ncbi:MAG: hypothetical protein HOG49_30400 [Candidatus Scalindua sp.]|jgi:hypothetical protein|nr:hypothetical protein [Candidatus Scalindua sp.]
MSTRCQVYFKNSGVYLYQHHDGYDLPMEVAHALSLEERWDDEEYLARIVFDCMKEGSSATTTGYGIGTVEHGDIEYLVVLDVKNQTVEIKYSHSETWSGSFSDFIHIGLEKIQSF